jgi:hypothetical protein
MKYLPGLGSNCDPPDLSLPGSKDYKHEPTGAQLRMCFLVVESMPVIRIPLQKEKSFCREFS